MVTTWIGNDEIFTVAFNTYSGLCFYGEGTQMYNWDWWGNTFQGKHFDMTYDISGEYLTLKKVSDNQWKMTFIGSKAL